MEWFKKHTDTVIILGSILSSVLWINGKFNELEKDMAIIKTVLIMKNIIAPEVFVKDSKEDDFGFVPFKE